MKFLATGGSLSQRDLDGHLSNACLYGYLADMKRLVAAGADVNYVRPDNCYTPLLAMAFEGHFRIIEALVQRGALVNQADKNGATALILCAERGHLRAVASLLDLGAVPDLARNDGSTPLGFAAQNGTPR